MQERGTLMDLFRNRSLEPVTPPKMNKKPKPANINQDEDDPLQKVLGWRDSQKQPPQPEPDTYKQISVPSIPQDDQKEWGKDFQGILINADWESLSFQQFSKLKLGEQMMDNGIVFIWGSNSNIGQMFSYFASQGFQYVENFMFVMLDRQKISAQKKQNNKNSLFKYFKKIEGQKPSLEQIPQKITKDYETGRVSKPQEIFLNQNSEYFLQSQKVLYLFRKQNKNKALELRHQRTSDAFFTIGDSNKLDGKSMEVVYKMIETLLIKANYKEGRHLKLLELWNNGEMGRKGWVTVSECKKVQ